MLNQRYVGTLPILCTVVHLLNRPPVPSPQQALSEVRGHYRASQKRGGTKIDLLDIKTDLVRLWIMFKNSVINNALGRQRFFALFVCGP